MKHKTHAVCGSRFTGEREDMLPSHRAGNRCLALVRCRLARTG